MPETNELAPTIDPAVTEAEPPAAVVPEPPAAPDAPRPSPGATDGGEAAGAESPTAPAAEPPSHGNAGKTPWYMKEITALRAKAREAEARATNAEQLAERFQRGAPAADEPPAAQPTTPTQPAAPRAVDPNQYQSDVMRAAQMLRLTDDTTAVKNAGVSQFGPAFGDTLGILNSLGAFEQNDFTLDVLAVDKGNAHVILDKLAKDPERAAALIGMDSRRRIVELTKMSAAESAAPKPAAAAAAAPAAPRAVSKAPPPPPAREAVSPTPEDQFADKVSDADWGANWDSKFKRRSA